VQGVVRLEVESGQIRGTKQLLCTRTAAWSWFESNFVGGKRVELAGIPRAGYNLPGGIAYACPVFPRWN
jgi:hypothetical protein